MAITSTIEDGIDTFKELVGDVPTNEHRRLADELVRLGPVSRRLCQLEKQFEAMPWEVRTSRKGQAVKDKLDELSSKLYDVYMIVGPAIGEGRRTNKLRTEDADFRTDIGMAGNGTESGWLLVKAGVALIVVGLIVTLGGAALVAIGAISGLIAAIVFITGAIPLLTGMILALQGGTTIAASGVGNAGGGIMKAGGGLAIAAVGIAILVGIVMVAQGNPRRRRT